VNRKHAYLYAVFNELKRLGHWKSDKKLDGVKALLRNWKRAIILTISILKGFFALISESCDWLFDNAYDALGFMHERANAELPDGQWTHILRHTLASYFMMKGGNLLVLQQSLEYSIIQMTMRYSHFSTENLEAANDLNPFNQSGKENGNWFHLDSI